MVLTLLELGNIGPLEHYGIMAFSVPHVFGNYKIGPCVLLINQTGSLFIITPNKHQPNHKPNPKPQAHPT